MQHAGCDKRRPHRQRGTPGAATPATELGCTTLPATELGCKTSPATELGCTTSPASKLAIALSTVHPFSMSMVNDVSRLNPISILAVMHSVSAVVNVSDMLISAVLSR